MNPNSTLFKLITSFTLSTVQYLGVPEAQKAASPGSVARHVCAEVCAVLETGHSRTPCFKGRTI